VLLEDEKHSKTGSWSIVLQDFEIQNLHYITQNESNDGGSIEERIERGRLQRSSDGGGDSGSMEERRATQRTNHDAKEVEKFHQKKECVG
jgi:hypothetical protein